MFQSIADCTQIRISHDINTIRSRAGLVEPAPADITLDLILNERSLELAFEGHQYRDTKRTRRAVGELSHNDARLIYPIP